MSILFRDQPSPIERVRIPAQFLNMDEYVRAMRGSSGVSVSVDSSMRHDAVWSCRTRIAEDVSMLPVDVVRPVGSTHQPVTPVPQIIAAPSVVTSAMDWRYQLIMAWTGHGNAWGIVTQRADDPRLPARIELRDQSCVRVQQVGQHVEFYVDNEQQELWPVGNLWHAPAYTVPGQFLGLSPIQYHATSIGKGMAAGLHGFQYFTDGAHPTHVAKLKGADRPKADAFKDRLMSLMRGNREPLVVDADEVDIVKLQSDPEDSQFIETERYSVEQVCRVFNCDPADHGSSAGGSAVTYANRAEAHFARMERRQFWITKMQEVLGAMVPGPAVVKLNTNATLMMTPKERHEVYGMRLEVGTMTIPEVRELEDEPPINEKQQRTWQEVGLPALVDGAILTPDEARAQLGLGPIPGGDKLREPTQEVAV